jgi:alcohol dehydrogenase
VVRLAVRVMTRKERAAAKARGVTYRYLFMAPNGAELAQIAALVEQGRIKPIVEKTFPLAEAAQAFAAVESGRTRGKVVVQVR